MDFPGGQDASALIPGGLGEDRVQDKKTRLERQS